MMTFASPFCLLARQVSWNAGSHGSKTNFAYCGTLERNLSRAPAGMMWSVVMRSPTLIAATPFKSFASGSPFGTWAMFGPRTIFAPATPFPAVAR